MLISHLWNTWTLVLSGKMIHSALKRTVNAGCVDLCSFFKSPWVMVLRLFKVHGKIDYRGNHFEMLEISTF